jgi:hypothetical protein
VALTELRFGVFAQERPQQLLLLGHRMLAAGVEPGERGGADHVEYQLRLRHHRSSSA